jgi:hypothetical protein
MQTTGTLTFRFCSGAALFLALFGAWNLLLGKLGRPGPILLFCLGTAAVFYVAGLWVRRMAHRAAPDA